MDYEKKLMTLDEFCEYVGIGKTKARELISNPWVKPDRDKNRYVSAGA